MKSLLDLKCFYQITNQKNQLFYSMISALTKNKIIKKKLIKELMGKINQKIKLSTKKFKSVRLIKIISKILLKVY
jgi:hypothetical protein